MWCVGKMHGKGTFVYPNGNKYEGDFVDNLKSGLYVGGLYVVHMLCILVDMFLVYMLVDTINAIFLVYR